VLLCVLLCLLLCLLLAAEPGLAGEMGR